MRRKTRVILSHDELSDVFFQIRDTECSIRMPKQAKKYLKEYARLHRVSLSTAVIRLCFYQIVAHNAENLRRQKWERIVWLGNYSSTFGLPVQTLSEQEIVQPDAPEAA